MDLLAATIDETLMAACSSSTGATDACTQSVRLHLAAGGARVRARICFEAATALGLSHADAVRTAAVCELLHNASLVQDDLLDRSTVRRGAPCVWVTYGDAVAVCAGDLMLSSAYGLLAEISHAGLIAPALRLVHRRTSEVILGQAAEGTSKSEREPAVAYYERLAQGKSSSLLGLSLELPLLLSGNTLHLAAAHAAACDFAVAYQIADDLTDLAQDMRERSLNLVLLLMEHDAMTRGEAWQAAVEIAQARLASSRAHASQLPNRCAAAMLQHGETLGQSLSEAGRPSPAERESGR
jgi:geranylgeranyl diphosphate synthase type II